MKCTEKMVKAFVVNNKMSYVNDHNNTMANCIQFKMFGFYLSYFYILNGITLVYLLQEIFKKTSLLAHVLLYCKFMILHST